MAIERYKGIIKDRTLRKMVLGDLPEHEVQKVEFSRSGRVWISTFKSEFVAERIGAKYWMIWQVFNGY